jgi:hypothetical protein
VLPNIALKNKMSALNNSIGNGSSTFGFLFTAPATLTDTMELGDTVVPTFPGYVAQGIKQGVVTGGTGITLATLSLPPVTFTCTASSSPQTIVGAGMSTDLLGSVGYDLLSIALLPNGPQVISQVGDSIVFQCTITDQRAPGQP